ncbi:hypothetical protein Pmani_016778 [Petrolisthes manimaculis]|uniref:Uncharacterized protein n=1 Tax=Petrolisthes manimaculis TaxID=1843537 RepID=A0AAE1U6D6_9EUCA|nr:hypothetical protein Pmani_016778 [Petrolisthes manimaculis]
MPLENYLGLIIYLFYGMSNSSVEYRMQGRIPPELKIHPEKIATMFDSESEDEIYSQPSTGSLTHPYSL